MVTTNYLRVVALLGAVTAVAFVVAAMVTYGPASAQDPCPGCGEPPPSPFITSPTDGATNVDRDSNIKTEFLYRMLKSTINGQTFKLYEGTLTYELLNPDPSCGLDCPPLPPSVEAAVSYNAKKKRATLNPGGRLAANTEYTAVVEGAGDLDGQAVVYKTGELMETDYIWHFTTGAE